MEFTKHSLPFYNYTSAHHLCHEGELPEFNKPGSYKQNLWLKRVPRREQIATLVPDQVALLIRGSQSIHSQFHNQPLDLSPPPSAPLWTCLCTSLTCFVQNNLTWNKFSGDVIWLSWWSCRQWINTILFGRMHHSWRPLPLNCYIDSSIIPRTTSSPLYHVLYLHWCNSVPPESHANMRQCFSYNIHVAYSLPLPWNRSTKSNYFWINRVFWLWIDQNRNLLHLSRKFSYGISGR